MANLVIIFLIQILAFYALLLLLKRVKSKSLIISFTVSSMVAIYLGQRIAGNMLVRDRVEKLLSDQAINTGAEISAERMAEQARLIVENPLFIFETIGGGLALATPSILLLYFFFYRKKSKLMKEKALQEPKD
jgi:hypothetical protein